ncbi:MAG: lysM [Proteobacteria bacterium]|nr:lysM [Pseudomonadota bacterium]
MGLLSFIREAGEKLFGGKAEAAADPVSTNRSASSAITAYIGTLQLPVSDLSIEVDTASHTARVSGKVPSQEAKEKVILACGNVEGIAQVEDDLTIEGGGGTSGEAQFHTVEKGDTLSAIAKKVYGDANAYNAIFEANKPMLKHPDMIYPGQVLRIPPRS